MTDRSQTFIADDWRTNRAMHSRGGGRNGFDAYDDGDQRRRSARNADDVAKLIAKCRDELEVAFNAVRTGASLDVSGLRRGVERIAASIASNGRAMPFVKRLRSQHEYTYFHSIAVSALLVAFALRRGWSRSDVIELGMAGLLHDIGKGRVSPGLLDKPGQFTEAEYELVRNHPVDGVEILRAAEGVPDVAIDVCLHHHERFDGSGYPFGLSGEAVSEASRMTAICDVFDAVTSVRPYKRPWSPAEAIEWMGQNRNHYDPALLGEFRALVGAFPVGTLVQLSSHRLAIVLDSDREADVHARLCAFYSLHLRQRIEPVQTDSHSDPIVMVDRAERHGFGDWNGLRHELLTTFSRKLVAPD